LESQSEPLDAALARGQAERFCTDKFAQAFIGHIRWVLGNQVSSAAAGHVAA
jgi:hypothetical protein